MRQKRAKTYRKLMTLYSMSFGFRQPYQVLVDSQICKEAIEHKIDLLKQLSSVLQGEVKPMITQCCIHELYLQKFQQPTVDLAKTFERRKCNHREAIPGDDCLTSVVGDTNKHRYVIATLSQPLRSKLRAVPAVPIVHINRSVMVLEPPSDVTIAAKQEVEEKILRAPHPVSPTTNMPPLKKKRGPKGPNPLSVQKKKKKSDEPASKEAPQKNSGDGTVRVGEKRERTDDNESHGEGGRGPTKKRKRKRGAKNSEPASVSHTAPSVSS